MDPSKTQPFITTCSNVCTTGNNASSSTSITTPLPIQILMSEILLLHLWKFMVFTTVFVSKYKDYNIFFKFSKLNFVASIYNTLFNYDLGLSLRHLQSHTMSSYQWHHSLQLVILVRNLKSTHDKFTISQQCNITLGALIPSITWVNSFWGHSCFYHSPPKYDNQSFNTINDHKGFKSFHEDLVT